MLDFLKKRKEQSARLEHNSIIKDPIIYDKSDLERRAKQGKPMTFEETEALRKYRQRDVTNQVLRLVGLLAILVIVIFAVGCFLYPYSLINFLGKDTFWNCWSNIGVYLGSASIEGKSMVLGNGGWVTLGEIYGGINVPMYDEAGELLKENILYAFSPNSPALMNFFALGGWTIIPLATIGLIGIVIVAIYMLVYNIKDLILVVKHLNNKTKIMVTDIAQSAKETALEVSDKEIIKKPRKRKTKTKVEDAPKTEEELEEEAVSKKMEEYKKTLIEEEENLVNEEEAPVAVVKTDDLAELSDDDLDKLLK